MKNKKLVCIMLMVFLFSISTSTIVTSNAIKNEDFKIDKQIVTTNNDNTPPNPPEISGPSSGKAGVTYEYSFTLTDDDEGDFLTILEVDFGNELKGAIKKNCEKPWENGTVITIEHKWPISGDYIIKARVIDSQGDWSEWSESFEVSMPKSNTFVNMIRNRLSNIFNLFSTLF